MNKYESAVLAGIGGAAVGCILCPWVCYQYYSIAGYLAVSSLEGPMTIVYLLCPIVGAAAIFGVAGAVILLRGGHRRAAGMFCMAPSIAIGAVPFPPWSGWWWLFALDTYGPGPAALLLQLAVPAVFSVGSVLGGVYMLTIAPRRRSA